MSDYKQKIKEEFEKIATYTNEYGYVHKIPKYDEIYDWFLSHALPIYRQHIIEKIKEVKEQTQKDTGSFKYDECYDEITNLLINKE